MNLHKRHESQAPNKTRQPWLGVHGIYVNSSIVYRGAQAKTSILQG